MTKRRFLGLLGAALVVCGVFTPVVTVPRLGELNFLVGSQGSGTLLVLLALATGYLTLTKRFRALWYTGGACLLVVLVAYMQLSRWLAADALAADASRLSWGWGILLAGIGATIAAAMIRENRAALNPATTVPEEG